MQSTRGVTRTELKEEKRGENECRKGEEVRIINRKKIKVVSIVREKGEKTKDIHAMSIEYC